MIQVDPDLQARTATASTAAAGVRAPWAERIPTARTLEKFVAEAQKAVRLRGQVSILLTTDKSIRRLNRDFRGKNKATDVLSFPAEAGFVGELIAGDLAISAETALKQAREQGHALTCELKILLLHGLLHLAGYDHEVDEGQMARRERTLRQKLRLPLGLIERAQDKPSAGTSARKPAAAKSVVTKSKPRKTAPSRKAPR